MDKFIAGINQLCSKLESKAGLFLASMIIGVGLMIIASSYVMPRFALSHHGIWYAALSQDPFSFHDDNPVQFRILLPAIGFILHLSQKTYFIMSFALISIFLGTIYFHNRKTGRTPSSALILACLMAFSCVTFIPLISPGYSDIATYLLIFLSFIYLQRPFLFMPAYTLALFNHESALLMAPALIAFCAVKDGINWRSALTGLCQIIPPILLYTLFRYYTSQQGSAGYEFSDYASIENIRRNFGLVARLAPAGAFFTFKLFWFVVICFVWLKIKKRDLLPIIPVALILIFSAAQLLVAYDISRLFALSFMAILISADELARYFPTKQFEHYGWTMIIGNFFVPQYFVSQEGLNDLFPPMVYLMEYLMKM